MSAIRISARLSREESDLLARVCHVETSRLFILPKEVIGEPSEGLLRCLKGWYDIIGQQNPMLDAIPVFGFVGWSIQKIAQIQDLQYYYCTSQSQDEDSTFLKQLNEYRVSFDLTEIEAVVLDSAEIDLLPEPTGQYPQMSWGAPLSFPRVVVGGTYDHLHAGHRLVLCLVIPSIVYLVSGGLDEGYLQGKKYKELIHSLSQRKDTISSFIHTINRELDFQFSVLTDPKEPVLAELDPKLDALVVSKETLSGGEAVNQSRLDRGLEKLHLIIVDCIGHDEETKLSSTELRKIESSSRRIY